LVDLSSTGIWVINVVEEKKKIEPKKQVSNEDKMTELVQTLQRVQAEFENYKKRVERDKKKVLDYSKEEVIIRLLPILDSFELAMQNADNTEFAKGIDLIFNDLMDTLQKEGLIRIEAQESFDPELHEALMTEEGKEDNKIIEELQKGYKLKEKVIRPAKVKISKKKKGDKHDKKHNKCKKDD
jgi:molecular chaperone GrpE